MEESLDCRIQLVIFQELPGSGSSVFNRSTIDYANIHEDLLPSITKAFKSAVATCDDLLKDAPAGADTPAFTGELALYYSDGSKQERSFPSLNFAGAQALMHAGLDLLAALANLPYQPNGQAVLARSGVKNVLPTSARYKLKNVKLLLLLAALLLSPLSACAQFVSPWHWTRIDAEEYALWHNGVQTGNYRLTDESYYPRLAPGKWGDATGCPCDLHPAIEAAQTEYRKSHWQTRGVLMGAPKPKRDKGMVNNHTLLPDKPKRKVRCDCTDCPPDCSCGCAAAPLSARSTGDIEKIPDYSAMPSLTLVARDEANARAALEMFEQAPELAHWRAKYGPRAKAYGLQEFRHTGGAFKLDQDRQFQKSGFVALVQPQAPDADGKAPVRSYYAWATPQQALKALRDADPNYDPNPAPPAASPIAAEAAPWGKIAYGAGLGGSSLLMALGSIVASLRAILR